MSWTFNKIDHTLFSITVEEDLGHNLIDITTDTLFDENLPKQKVSILSKQPHAITIAGLNVIDAILKQFKMPYSVNLLVEDGAQVQQGEFICHIEAQANLLLKAERTILNFLRHLSAIATITRKFCDKISHTQTKILDTRKTTPGMRHLEKYAIVCGGGCNHRMGLFDAMMIKDTHVDLIGGMQLALEKLPAAENKQHPVIVEVRSLDELNIVLQYGINKVDRVLLDNMNNNLLKACVDASQGKFSTEASGNINLQTIRGIAETGIDFASIGMITHSAGSVDLSMRSAS